MKLRKTRHPLDKQSREKSVALLNDFLVLAIDLRLQVKQAHWNVRGPNFISLHELFDRLAGELEETVDELAERVTALGGRALGTASRIASKTDLGDLPKKATWGPELVALVADRYAEPRGYLDSLLNKYVVRPFLALFRWCDGLERKWTDFLSQTDSRESDRVPVITPAEESP